MKVIFVRDLHGSKWKYDELFSVEAKLELKVIINSGDMLLENGNLYSQADFIIDYLDSDFASFNEFGIYYLCFLSNNDQRIFNEFFEKEII